MESIESLNNDPQQLRRQRRRRRQRQSGHPTDVPPIGHPTDVPPIGLPTDVPPIGLPTEVPIGVPIDGTPTGTSVMGIETQSVEHMQARLNHMVGIISEAIRVSREMQEQHEISVTDYTNIIDNLREEINGLREEKRLLNDEILSLKRENQAQETRLQWQNEEIISLRNEIESSKTKKSKIPSFISYIYNKKKPEEVRVGGNRKQLRSTKHINKLHKSKTYRKKSKTYRKKSKTYRKKSKTYRKKSKI